MQTRVLLLRHAETTHPHIFNGAESDVGLSPRGQRQARAIAPVLAQAAPAVVVSSAMQRALHTANPIAEACGLPVKVERELHERRVGAFVGKTHKEVAPLWQDAVRRWCNGDPEFSPGGGESFADMERRVLPIWGRLTQQYQGQTLVIVAHGHVCRVLLVCLLPAYSVADWARLGRIDNVAIHELVRTEDAWQAVRINHLEEAVLRVNRDPALASDSIPAATSPDEEIPPR